MGGVVLILPIKTHLKVVFGFNGVLDLAFLFIEDIWHYVPKGSGYIPSSISCQNFSVSPSINDLLDRCPNMWCNNSKETFFLGVTFFHLAFLKPKIHVSSVQYVVESPHFYSYHQSIPFKTLFEINKYVPNLLTQ